MKYAEVAENVKQLVESPPAKEEFIVELLLAYDPPRATISRLKKGELDMAKSPGELLLKKKVCFKAVESNVAQASRLPNVPQASSLLLPKESSDGRQASSLSTDVEDFVNRDRQGQRLDCQRQDSNDRRERKSRIRF